MRVNFFAARTGSSTFFSSSTSNSEIDLRAELDELFFGFKSGKRHGYPVVVRHIRLDSNRKPIDCTCRHETTREPDLSCSYCFGHGYLADEQWYWTYSMYTSNLASKNIYLPPGQARVDYKIFFFRYDVPIKYGDKIIEMKLDNEGAVITPYVRDVEHKPQTINNYRSDNSRKEYIAVYCREEDALRSDVL